MDWNTIRHVSALMFIERLDKQEFDWRSYLQSYGITQFDSFPPQIETICFNMSRIAKHHQTRWIGDLMDLQNKVTLVGLHDISVQFI